MSRAASPNMLVPYTTVASASPGHSTVHGATNMNSRLRPLSMAPQLGNGGWIPKPRKLRLASARMIAGMRSVSRITAGARTLGRMWRSSTRLVRPPIADAAVT